MSRNYLVLDIETVHDPSMPWDAAVDGFPPAPFHQVVALGVLWLDPNYGFRRLGAFGPDDQAPFDEATVLNEFAAFVGKERPHFVTYNGRGFDLPVLTLRMMRHGITFAAYYSDRDYRYRFSDQGHIDLQDVLTDYGASRRPSLDALSRLIGLPGKMDVDGSKVQAMYEAGQHQEIRDYCLHDVVQTAFVFLRSELLAGRLSQANYKRQAKGLWDALQEDARVSAVFERSDRARVLLE